MILAFTGAGISKASGIPTFNEMGDMREKLSRSFCTQHPEEFQEIIQFMENACNAAEPNDAHFALAEYNVPIITMNVDMLHQRAGSKNVLPIHGQLPDKVVLYGDPAPLYETAHDWIFKLRPGDTFLIVGTSYYTTISSQLKICAQSYGARVVEINEDAEHRVRAFLQNNVDSIERFEDFLEREE